MWWYLLLAFVAGGAISVFILWLYYITEFKPW